MTSVTILETDGVTRKNQRFRAPSPTPSSNDFVSHKNLSMPRLHHRRSSLSTNEEKPLVGHKSFPHLKKYRSGSEYNTTDDEEGNISITASIDSSLVALPTTFASEKRNRDFHHLFKNLPENERLVEDYASALHKEKMLHQGRLYISENHLCFHSNIFGIVNHIEIPYNDIKNIEKKMSAYVVPNAILISTFSSSEYFLGSFLSRDHAYDLAVKLWKASQVLNSNIDIHHDKYKGDDDADDSTEFTSSDGSYSGEEDDQISPVSPSQREPRPVFEKQSSLPSLPATKNMPHLDDASRRRAVSEAGVRPSVQKYTKHDQDTATPVVTEETEQIKEKTECECHRNGQHFPTVVMDNNYQTTLENMYNILYNSPFMANFLSEVEKNTNICIGDWSDASTCVQARETSYTKYLGIAVRPRSATCYLKEEMLYLDTKNYISQLTVTQTPEVPSGENFSVKTKTCISWSGKGQVRVLVTVLVEFTKSSWLKSTIEKASIDGQQKFYKNLDTAIRKHLETHAPNQGIKSTHRRKKRRHRPHTSATPPTPPPATSTKLDFIQRTALDTLSSIVECVSGVTTPQLTAFCVVILLLSNIYIASKMAGVNNRILQIHTNRYQPTSYKDPISSMNTKEQHDIADERLEYYRTAKHRLDLKIAELNDMISKTGHNMNQVSKSIKNQKYQILHSDI